MELQNRVIAREGPRKKDGVLQHYDLSEAKFTEKWLTFHTHPANNAVKSNQIIGRIKNERLKNGALIVDMDIFDDILTPEQLQHLKDNQDVSIGYLYEAGTDELIAHPIRKVKIINHVVIGTEKGVCSFPECGLNVTATDSNTNSTDYVGFKSDFEIFDQGLIKMADPVQKTLDIGCDEKDAQIEQLQNELKNTQEELKVAADAITAYEADAKSTLIESLSKRLKIDADSLKERNLSELQKLDQDTSHIPEQVGLRLKKKDLPKEGADEAEEDTFELTEDGELPMTSFVKDHDFYKGVDKQ